MTYDFTESDAKLQDVRAWLAREYSGLRTGRASPAILDGISVSAYGSMMPLKQVANISTEDARTLRVSPWDVSVSKDIERAIAAADLGVGVMADSNGVRVTFPELTAERRADLIKMAKRKLEEARAAIRVARDDVRKDIQTKQKAAEMSEDDKFHHEEELQTRVDAANADLERAFTSKEKEMTS
jgi:ribosome recycling factor